MIIKTTTLVILSFLILFSCKAQEKHSKMEKVESVLIAKGNLYGSGSEGIVEQNLIISNQKDWNDLLIKMDSINKVSNSFLETNIDFSLFNVIAVFDKVRGSGGYSLNLNIVNDSENILINTIYLSPKGIANAIMTQPFCLVKISKTDLKVIFNSN